MPKPRPCADPRQMALWGHFSIPTPSPLRSPAQGAQPPAEPRSPKIDTLFEPPGHPSNGAQLFN
jgi:hypothetical protein